MMRARERAPTPSPSVVFTFGLTIESIKKLEGVSRCMGCMINHFKTKVQTKLDMEDEQNIMIMLWNVTNLTQQRNSK
jgi:hypothetical protein